MQGEEMTTNEILRDILSKDTHRVWFASGEIISMGQDQKRILPLIPHLLEIKRETAGLSMGGAFASNQRLVDFAIKTIEFYRDSSECPCRLYPESGGDCIFNPMKEAERGNVKIIETVPFEKSEWIDYYLVECLKCGQRFKVIEREYHFTWWQWTMF